MSHMKRIVMAWQHIAILVLLMCGGQAQQDATSQSVVAIVGDDVVLPCSLEAAVDASGLTVEWARLDLNPRFVYLRRDSEQLQSAKNELYSGRTSLSITGLKRGDVSLKISKVKLSDAGTYRCHVPTTSTDSSVVLTVGSVSPSEIHISKANGGVMLECKSSGWYPQPEVSWLDGEGNLLSAGPTETSRGPGDLYTVNSRLTVENRHSSSFTCRVQQKNISQTRETHVYLAVQLFVVKANSAVRVSIVLVACIVAIAAVVTVVYKCGQKKTKTTNNHPELQLLMDEESHRENLMTGEEKLHSLDKTKAKLEEELQKNEGELNHVKDVIEKLMDQKKKLKDQTDNLISLQKDDEVQRHEWEKKQLEGATFQKEKKQKKREKAKEDVEKRRNVHENLLKDTKDLQETTESLITAMIERKGKLERDVEQIQKHLKETKRKMEDAERKLQLEKQEREKLEMTQDPTSPAESADAALPPDAEMPNVNLLV